VTKVSRPQHENQNYLSALTPDVPPGDVDVYIIVSTLLH
jgi:hypothetical protein